MATDQKQHGFYVQSRQRDNCQTLRTKNTIFPVIIFKKNIQAHRLFLNVFYLVGWHSQLWRDEAPNVRPQKPRHFWLAQQSVSSECVLVHKTSQRTAPLSPTQGQPMRNRAITQRCVIVVQYLQFLMFFVITINIITFFMRLLQLPIIPQDNTMVWSECIVTLLVFWCRDQLTRRSETMI